MANKVLLSPLIARLSGTMSHPNTALVVRYTGVGTGSLITPKSHGGPETKTKIWALTQWIWNYLDDQWSNLPQSSRLLWHSEAHNTKHRGRDGFQYYKRVNIMRLLFWFPPLPRPPNTCESVRQCAVTGPDYPGLFPGAFKPVWVRGLMLPKGPDDPFDPETPDDPLPPLPPPDAEEPGDPPGPPWFPCYPPEAYTITSSSGPHGMVVYEGTFTPRLGDKLTFTPWPDCGYDTDEMTKDGYGTEPPGPITIGNIHADHVIYATFKPHYYDFWSDTFERTDPTGLGECWLHRHTSNMLTYTDGHYARSTYNQVLGGMQTNHEYARRQLEDQFMTVEVDWTGVNTMAGPGEYKSYLNLRLLIDDVENPTSMAYCSIIDSHGPQPSEIRIYEYDRGRARLKYQRDTHDNLAGDWRLVSQETGGSTYRILVFHGFTLYGNVVVLLTGAGSAVGFSHRMTRIAGPNPSGYSAIGHFRASVRE